MQSVHRAACPGLTFKRFIVSLGNQPQSASPARVAPVKDPEYQFLCGISLADWLIYHQEQVLTCQMTWMGHPIVKNPLDCWIYQELIWQVKPDVLIELGS